MGDEDRGQELPQRVRGAARPGPPPSAPSLSSASPALSEELRQRMQAAVEAERARAATPTQERTTEPPRANGHTKRSAKPESAVRPGRTAKAERAAMPERTAEAETRRQGPGPRPSQPKPAAEDELREWLKPAVTPQPATQTEPAGSRQTGHKPAAVPARTSRATPRRSGTPKIPGRRRSGLAILALVVITFVAVGALAVAAVKHFARSPSSGPQLSTAQLRQEAVEPQPGGRLGGPAGQPGPHRGLRQGDVCRAQLRTGSPRTTCLCSGRPRLIR